MMKHATTAKLEQIEHVTAQATDTPYILLAYGLGLGVILLLLITAFIRRRKSRSRLAQLSPE